MRGLDISKLAELAAQLGSDVPFFIFESAARCTGRGELVASGRPPKGDPAVVGEASVRGADTWAYGKWKDSKELPGISYEPQEFGGFTFKNDLERPVFEKYLFLARTKMWLLAQPEVGAAMLSGSGSTVFAVLRDGAEADALAARVREELDPRMWTCACETSVL